MTRICNRVVSVFSIFLVPFLAFGAIETFPIQTYVGNDTTPPSIPQNLVATGVATTQIDLSWDPSTDNFVLSGYHIWRDGIRIATTSTTTYTDTGLTASTSYVYYVTAFDPFFNESASSSVATGTTLSSPPPEEETEATTTGTIFGSKRRSFENQILSLELYPQKDSVALQFETRDRTRTVIKWGTGISYELGVLTERAFQKQHHTTISGLSPGMRYAYVIEGELPNGKYGILHTGTFMTVPPDDIIPPGNVTQLRAQSQGTDVVLSWNNPLDLDFSYVRIVRNEAFYPNDIADGWVVYEGSNSDFIDLGALAIEEVQYYTVFAYDFAGNISSGAVVVASSKPGGVSVTPDETKNEIGLTFEKIQFFQDGAPLIIVDDSVILDGTKPFMMRIPYETLPEHLKTILVTLAHPNNTNEVFSFLLRVNKDKTAYESILAPLGISGSFPVHLSVFDYETQQIGITRGLIISHIGLRESPESGVFVPVLSQNATVLRTIVIALLSICILIIGIRIASKMFIVVRK